MSGSDNRREDHDLPDDPAPDDETDGGAVSDLEDVEAAAAAAAKALNHLEFVNITPIAIHADANDDHPVGRSENVSLNIELKISVGPGEYANLVTFTIEMTDDAGNVAGNIEFSLRIDYAVEEDYEVPQDAAPFIARTTGLFAAYPYARELAQNLATRLQFDPFVLGFLRRGAMRPESISRPVSRDRAGAPEQPQQDG